jgi:hypothetical protein
MNVGKNLKICVVTAVFVLAITPMAVGKIIFADDDADGANDGASWADAYNDLQDALTVAQAGDEIRIAQGIYKSGPPPPPL